MTRTIGVGETRMAASTVPRISDSSPVIADSRMVVIEGHGHVPHLSAPTETLKAIRGFLAR